MGVEVTTSGDIPIFSFTPFLEGKNEQEQKDLAAKMNKAFSTVGFVYLKDFGITEAEVEHMFAITKRFFEIPMESKLKWKLGNPDMNQGYSPEGQEQGDGVDHKESYEHRRFKNDKCPTDAEFPGFKKDMNEFYAKCQGVCELVLRCLAMGLGLPSTFFDGMTTNADAQLRLIHYPPVEKWILEQEKHARIIPHTDFGFITLLFQDSVGGLEIDAQHNGVFSPATPIPGTVLINIADLLQRLSNDRLKSTIHQVVAPNVDGDKVPSRYSIPFFYYPSPESEIDPIVLTPGEVKKYETINAGYYRKISKYSTYPDLAAELGEFVPLQEVGKLLVA